MYTLYLDPEVFLGVVRSFKSIPGVFASRKISYIKTIKESVEHVNEFNRLLHFGATSQGECLSNRVAEYLFFDKIE